MNRTVPHAEERPSAPSPAAPPPLGLTRHFALRAAAWLFCLSGLDALLVMLVPKTGGSPRWVEATGVAVFLASGLALMAVPRVPDWFLSLAPLMGVGGVSWYAWTGEPSLGEFAFYMVVIAFSGMFLSRANLVVTFVASAASFAVAVALAEGGHARVQLWVVVTMVTASGALLVRFLRERLDAVTADLARGANHDALTGLLNRHGIASAPVSRDDLISVVVFDLDHFKQLNDAHGHAAGDRALSAFARLLAGHARHEDVVGRTGGEEFVAILPGCDTAQAAAFAERVRRAAADADGGTDVVTVSAGVASSASGARVEDLQREADRALYRAKDEGRNRVVISETVVAGAPPSDGSASGGGPHVTFAALVRAAWHAAVTGAPRPGLSARAARQAAGVLYALGAVVCVAITASLPVLHGHRHGLMWTGVAMGVSGVALFASSRLDRVAGLIPYLGVATTCVIVWMADPYTGTMVFLAWPLLFTAYFFSARAVVGALGIGVAGLAVALWLTVEQASPLVMWINATVALVLITLLTLSVQLHIERVHGILADLATTDALTSLPNRRAFYERAAGASGTGPFAVVVFDLDHFKRVNDRSGHDAGDAVLRLFASALRAGARSGDLVARHGGEEFAAVLRGADHRSACAFAERVRSAFHDDALREGWDVTSSAGVSVAGEAPGEPAASLDAWVARADAALYRAKRDGRDAVRVWDPADAGSEAV